MTRIPLTLLIILSFSFLANAQISKGSILLGGELSFYGNSSSNYGNDQNVHSGYFNISIGKAINETSVLGINLSYLPERNSNYYYQGMGPVSYKNNGYAIGIFYRKYKTLGKDFYLFGEAGAEYNWSNESGSSNTGDKLFTGTSSGGQLSFFPGIAYKISNKVFLEISIPDLIVARYSSTKITDQVAASQNSKSDQFTISTSLNSNPLSALGIGFRLIL